MLLDFYSKVCRLLLSKVDVFGRLQAAVAADASLQRRLAELLTRGLSLAGGSGLAAAWGG